jgi:AcrR family transcriptional regulator
MPSQKSSTLSAPREPKRERGKLRVAALLDAGAAVFVEKGYDAATMTEIAQRANTAIGSLYQFFPSKEALADALLTRYGTLMAERLSHIAEQPSVPGPDSLADALVNLVLDLQSERAIAISLIDALGAADKRSLLRDTLRQRLASILRTMNPTLGEAKAATMAIVSLHMLKAVRLLAEEEAAGHAGLVAEARGVLRLYIAQAMGDRV